jgi:hypothetical protein
MGICRSHNLPSYSEAVVRSPWRCRSVNDPHGIIPGISAQDSRGRGRKKQWSATLRLTRSSLADTKCRGPARNCLFLKRKSKLSNSLRESPFSERSSLPSLSERLSLVYALSETGAACLTVPVRDVAEATNFLRDFASVQWRSSRHSESRAFFSATALCVLHANWPRRLPMAILQNRIAPITSISPKVSAV